MNDNELADEVRKMAMQTISDIGVIDELTVQVSDLCDEVTEAVERAEKAEAQRDRLLAAIAAPNEAWWEMVNGWQGYASNYFKEKWSADTDLEYAAQLDAVAAEVRAEMEDR